MKEKIKLNKLLLLLIIFFFSNGTIGESSIIKLYHNNIYLELIYDNIWGSIYNPVKEQCNDNPTVTGDGSIIDIKNASNLRWLAISQNMLNCEYRQNLLNNDTILYRGKIEYGDTVLIVSPNNNINGIWVVHDTKNKRYINSIDFLQTVGDGSLYNNNENWNGRFDNIKIYKIVRNIKYNGKRFNKKS